MGFAALQLCSGADGYLLGLCSEHSAHPTTQHSMNYGACNEGLSRALISSNAHSELLFFRLFIAKSSHSRILRQAEHLRIFSGWQTSSGCLHLSPNFPHTVSFDPMHRGTEAGMRAWEETQESLAKLQCNPQLPQARLPVTECSH